MVESTAPDYITRRLTPADALKIPELTTRVNGPGYIHAEVYHPEQLLKLNQNGRLVSVVAVHAADEVVGHTALERPELELIAESGEAMVLPEHRHHHLLDRMKLELEDEALKLGLVGIFGNAVTHHVFSQLTEERYKGRPTCFLLGASPASAHRIEGSYPQRVSLLTYFTYLCEPGRTAAHVPERHRAILGRIYDLLGRRVEFGAGGAPSGAGKLSSTYDPATQKGIINVEEPGAQSAAQIEQARRDLLGHSGAEVIYLELPLDRPASAELCAQAEGMGFFFSGIAPQHPSSGDHLRLQFLKAPLDLGLLQIAGEFARELLAYIGSEMGRLERTRD
jgi:hypothetical protein